MSEWEKNPRILISPEGHRKAKILAAHTGETMGIAAERAIAEKLERIMDEERRRTLTLSPRA